MNKSLFIDVKETEILTYLLENRKGNLEAKEVKRYKISDKYQFLVDRSGEAVENAYLSLPLSSLNFRVIELPFSDQDKIREVLPFELDGIILGGSGEVIFDDIILGKSGDKYKVLAVYTDKKIIKEILEKLKQDNIDPEFITSVELKNIIGDFSLDSLLVPSMLSDEERLKLAVDEINAPVINLRRDEFSYTRNIEKTKRSLRITAALILLIVIVLSADVFLNIFSMRSDINSLKNEMRKEYQQIFPVEKNIINELHQLKSHMRELKDKEQVLIGSSPLNLLLNLSGIDKHGVMFDEVSTNSGNISLKGEAQSLSDIQQVKAKLENIFDDVNITESKTSVQGSLLFTITAREKKA
jgi:type II secretory pathway component PulL